MAHRLDDARCGTYSDGYKTEAAYPVSTDPMRVKQTYLDMIHIDQAWAAAGDSRASIVVAVVDTGVDLTHPDLVGNLVDGVNLLQPSKSQLTIMDMGRT